METYVILRRHGFRDGEDLRAAAERSTIEGEEMADGVRWIRSYVLAEEDGTLGTVCIYQATSPDAIFEHARRAGLPADEVISSPDTVIVRPDPEPVAA
jgi:Protein of unknown function (DUF4242)